MKKTVFYSLSILALVGFCCLCLETRVLAQATRTLPILPIPTECAPSSVTLGSAGALDEEAAVDPGDLKKHLWGRGLILVGFMVLIISCLLTRERTRRQLR